MKKGSVRKLTISAALIAMQIILARISGFYVNEGLRISIEGIPIILAGVWLGPIYGMIVGGLSDVLGSVLSGYGTYFPLLSVGPMLFGGLVGVGAKYLLHGMGNGWRYALRFVAIAILAGAINSLLYGTWALTVYYSVILGKSVPFSALLLARLAVKPITIAVDAVLSYSIFRLLYKRFMPLSPIGSGGEGDQAQAKDGQTHEL